MHTFFLLFEKEYQMQYEINGKEDKEIDNEGRL